VKEKGISKIITAAVITIVVVVAGIGAYFLMEAENSPRAV